MKAGTLMNLLALLGGVWVWFAPALAGFAPKHGSPWGGIILGSDIIAGLVIVIALAGLTGFWFGFLHHIKAVDSDA